MTAAWYRDLFKIGSAAGAVAVVFRVALAVGIPMIGFVSLGRPHAGVAGGATALFVTLSDIGQTPRVRLGTMFAGWVAIVAGGTLGHLLGDTPYSREIVVLLCALVAGWASGSHPGVAAITRFFAVAAAAGTGMHFGSADVMLNIVVGGATAFASAFLVWHWFRIPSDDNVMDWHAGVRRACLGADAGIRFTVCYGAAAAVALFAASSLGVNDPFWATFVVLMVMRREGTESLELTIHYAAGTIVGVLLGAAILQLHEGAVTLAVLATLVAALARVGTSINPALGFAAFTMFLLFAVHAVVAVDGGSVTHLLATRMYDVTVGCIIALVGTLAATYPRFTTPQKHGEGGDSATARSGEARG
jgi:Fusaric acid resistance protein-like